MVLVARAELWHVAAQRTPDALEYGPWSLVMHDDDDVSQLSWQLPHAAAVDDRAMEPDC